MGFLKPFIFVVLLFSLIVQLGHLFDRLEVFANHHVPLNVVVSYLFAMLPLWLVQALPLCTLIAGVTVIGNMASSGELITLRSSGISGRAVLKPLFCLAIFLTLLTFLLGEHVMPKATAYAKNLYRTYVDKEGVQKPVWDDIIVIAAGKRRISAKRLDVEKKEMEIVTVEEYGDHFNLRETLTAKKAEWYPNKGWVFYDGVIRLFAMEGDEIVAEEPFLSCELPIAESPTDLVPLSILPEELSSSELRQYIQKISSLGISSLKEEVQYYLKYAFPFTHILVLAIGLPVAYKMTPTGGGRGRKAFGRMKTLFLALLVGFIYYLFITIGQALGESRKLPPWLGIWTANFIFLILGITLLKKVE